MTAPDTTATARRAIQHVLNGNAPNGVAPTDCGPWCESVQALYGAYERAGTPEVRRVWGVLVKAHKGLAALVAGDEPAKGTRPGPRLIGAKALMAKTFQPVKWVVPDVLPEGVAIFAGRPKMGKSWLALNLALATACGGRALGKILVEQGSVLYLALEDNERRLQGRMAKLLCEQPAPERLDIALEWPRLGDETDGITLLDTWIHDHPDARLIVVDTLAKIRPPMGKNSNVYEADYNALQGLKALSDKYALGILVIHHTRKGTSDDPLEMVSGSFGLTGGVDGVLVLKRDRGQADAVLHVTGRDVEEKELALVWAPDMALWTIAGDADEYRTTKERRQLLDLLTGMRDGMTPKELSDATQRPVGNIRKMLRDMLGDGQVQQSGYGRYISIPKN